ncbi:MAG: hypothetical protein ACRDLF_10530, partial [Solirubrobacteraceae bacterium]
MAFVGSGGVAAPLVSGGRPLSRARGLHTAGLAALLAEVGRPRSVAEALALVAVGKLKQGVQGAGVAVDGGGGVAALAQAGGDGVEAQ